MITRICLVQSEPVKGDFERNIKGHLQLLELAVDHNAELVIFPELSLTGYEPTLAEKLAGNLQENRLVVFDEFSSRHDITVGVGLPIRTAQGVCISMAFFQSGQSPTLYSKRYLHRDEKPYFIAGEASQGNVASSSNIALAICYELSVPDHAEQAFRSGADTYVASVCKSTSNVVRAEQRLAEIAGRYSMMVGMANSVGYSDGESNAGKSAVWNRDGVLLAQLDDSREGVIVFDTVNQSTACVY